MGLGKTLLALTEFAGFARDKICTRMVVIAPNSFKSGWRTEIRKHGFDFDVHVYEASKHAKAVAWLEKGFTKPPVLIVNYEAARLDKTLELIEAFATRKPTVLVLDESDRAQEQSGQADQARPRHGAAVRPRPPAHRPADDAGAARPLGPAPGHRRLRPQLLRFPQHLLPHGRLAGAPDHRRAERGPAPGDHGAARLPGREGRVAREPAAEDLHHPDLRPRSQVGTEIRTRWRPPSSSGSGAAEGPRTAPSRSRVAIAQYQKLLQIQCGFVHDEGGIVNWLVEDKDNPRLALLDEVLEGVTSKVAIVYSHRAVGSQLAVPLPGRRAPARRHAAGRDHGGEGALQHRSEVPRHPAPGRRLEVRPHPPRRQIQPGTTAARP